MDKKTFLVVALAFLLTWVPVALFWWAGGVFPSVYATVLLVLLMWVPGGVAIWAARREGMHIPIFHMGGYLAAGLIALLVAALSIGFSLLMGFHFVAPPHLPLLPVVVLIAGLSINAVAALGEELMWRGYLWKKVAHLGAIRSTLLIGTIWGVWHFPIILLGLNFPGYPIAGLGMMVVSCIAMSPLLSWLRARSGGVAAPAAFHGTINAAGGLAIFCFPGANPLLVGLTAVSGAVACLLVLGLPILAKKTLLRSN